LLLGIAGAVAGAGLAGPHLAKAGLDVAAVLAVVVLVTGLTAALHPATVAADRG
jgi:hypothetical protein